VPMARGGPILRSQM